MTDRERYLAIGLITRIYTCSLDSSKSLDEQCEDFISLGEKMSNIINKNDTIAEKIKFHENKIKDIQHEMYVQKVLSVIPQINPLHIV